MNEGLHNETKGFLGGGAILATGIGITAFILAVFSLVYLNNANIDDYSEERKKQMYNTAWAYFAFLFAAVVFVVLFGASSGTTWKDIRAMMPGGRLVRAAGGEQYVLFGREGTFGARRF